MRMTVERQLSLILENQPGVLAEVGADLAAGSINIQAVQVANLADHCVVRMVVSDPQRALHLLGAAGALVLRPDVIPDVDGDDRHVGRLMNDHVEAVVEGAFAERQGDSAHRVIVPGNADRAGGVDRLNRSEIRYGNRY